MLAEVNAAQKYIKENYGDNPAPGSYAVPWMTRGEQCFMKVTLDKDLNLSDFHLYWDKEFTLHTHEPKQGYLTFQKLKDFCNGLTDEQLSEPVRWWGDERGGKVVSAQVLDEDFYRTDEYVTPESEMDWDEYDEEDKADITVAMKKGTPILYVD